MPRLMPRLMPARTHARRRVARRVGLAALFALGVPCAVSAQPRVALSVPGEPTLASVSPRATVRVVGAGDVRPLRITLRVAENPLVLAPFLVDTTVITNDTVVTIATRRALPSGGIVYVRAVAEVGVQVGVSDAVGPRTVPSWVELVSPASPQGDILDTRQPTFQWRSPRVDTGPGPWRYDLEVLSNGLPVFGASNIPDTVFRVPTALQSNSSYRWRVTARLVESSLRVSRESPGSFVIVDPPLPTATLFYQNFPNPFPSPASFTTCFWFDIALPGAEVSLEILDLRGSPVQTVIPAADGQREFPAGRYGRGIVGSGNNCDNRFIWDGTARDGRPVPPGVYLARFRAGSSKPVIRRILFRGR